MIRISGKTKEEDSDGDDDERTMIIIYDKHPVLTLAE